MKLKTYTVVCVCCCGCDNNEIHWLEATSAEQAVKKLPKQNEKRIVAVFKGAQTEARKNAD